MRELVTVVCEPGGLYSLSLRVCTPADGVRIVERWPRLLEMGPGAWLDRDWNWEQLDAPSELHIQVAPEWLVVVDDCEPQGAGDVLGVLVTTGPVTPTEAGLERWIPDEPPLLWVENIAIAPSIRPDCPAREKRTPAIKGVGAQLMMAAIERSRALDCGGRIGLHAEGAGAQLAYTRWQMRRFGDASHRGGGAYPVFVGNEAWATQFYARNEERKEPAR